MRPLGFAALLSSLILLLGFETLAGPGTTAKTDSFGTPDALIASPLHLLGKHIPLPGNKWQIISSYSETVRFGQDEAHSKVPLIADGSYEVMVIVLAELDRNVLSKVVLIQMPMNIPETISLGMRDECDYGKNFFCEETSRNEQDQSQWWINGLLMEERSHGQRFVDDLFKFIHDNDVSFPSMMYAVHFQFVKPLESLSVSYLWNHETGGLHLDTLIQWGLRWNDIVRKGFDIDALPVNYRFWVY